MQDFRHLVLVCVCLTFTGTGVAWADHATVDFVENPYAPHKTVGQVVRIGTLVGQISTEHVDATVLGIMAAYGHRFGRFAVDSELSYLQFSERGDANAVLGDGFRVGVMGRFDVLRLGPQTVGPNSMLAFYVEGGAAVAWNQWWKPGVGEAMRTVPDNTKRVELTTGFGLEIDHRLQEPVGFPRRIGWTLGLRLAAAPHGADGAVVCRSSGTSCRTATPVSEERYTDQSMLFQSSFGMTW